MLPRWVFSIVLTVFVAGVVAAGPAGAAPPKPPGVLWANAYDDLQPPGVGIVSDRYNDPGGILAAESSEAADDFTVPARRTWTVREVDVAGFYHRPSGGTVPSLGAGPADRFHVGIASAVSVGGTLQPDPLRTVWTTASPVEDGNGFTLELDTSITVFSGHHFVLVVAELSYTLHGQWRWETSGLAPRGASAVWRQDHPDRSCTQWCTLSGAWPSSFDGPADLRFRLLGSSS